MVRLYENESKNYTTCNGYILQHMTIVMFIDHPFDKLKEGWYSDVGNLRKERCE